jgi:hypothetical protein
MMVLIFVVVVVVLFLVGLGFELRALRLQSRCSTASVMPPVQVQIFLKNISSLLLVECQREPQTLRADYKYFGLCGPLSLSALLNSSPAAPT